MKYHKVTQVPEEGDGKWYVLKGNTRYFTNSGCDTEEQAMQKAAVLSAHYYMQKSLDCLLKVTEPDQQTFWKLNAGVSRQMGVIEELHTKQPNYDEYDPCTWM